MKFKKDRFIKSGVLGMLVFGTILLNTNVALAKDNNVDSTTKPLYETTVTSEESNSNARGTYHYKVTLKRGGFFLWSKDIVEVQSNHYNHIYNSWAYQDWGWIFPNYIEGKGIYKVGHNSNNHIYRGQKYVTAGIPTPWGPISPFGQTVNDHIRVWADGGIQWW